MHRHEALTIPIMLFLATLIIGGTLLVLAVVKIVKFFTFKKQKNGTQKAH